MKANRLGPVACMLAVTVMAGCATTKFNWIPGIDVAHRITAVGTIIAGPVASSESSQGQDVLILDTSIHKRVTCIRFPGEDYRRLEGKLVLGGTVGVVYTGHPLSTDFEMTCLSPLKWEIRSKGNPSRRDFLIEHRDAILLKALRGRPQTMRHFYGSDLGGFIAIIGEFSEICETVVNAGAADLVCPN